MRRHLLGLALVVAATSAAPAFAAADKAAVTDKTDVKAWADRAVDKSGWTYMGVVARSAAPFALYMTEGPASADVKRAIWLRNEYMVETNGYRSLQALLDIDCALMQVRIKKSIAFKENNLKNRVSIDEQPSAWQPAQSGSVLSGVVKDTCRGPTPGAGGAPAALTAADVARAGAAAASPPSEDATPRARPVLESGPVTTAEAAPPPAAAAAPDPAAEAPRTAASPPPSAALGLRRTALSAPNVIGRTRGAGRSHIPVADRPETARSAPSDGPRIQLGAFASRAIAETAAIRVRAQSATALKGRSTEIQTFESGHGSLYRLLLGPFADAQEAASTCQTLKAHGQACFLRR